MIYKLRKFESFVNSEECKTYYGVSFLVFLFESFVNSEECKTINQNLYIHPRFESFVNSEECKTAKEQEELEECLRALLIQKSVKLLFLS